MAENTSKTPQASGLEGQFATNHEFVKAAKMKLNPMIWDYLIGATETETTLRRNRAALDAIALRPRVLRDVGVTRAKALYSVINNDFANLEIGLNARSFAPDLRLILRIFDEAMSAQLKDTLAALQAVVPAAK